VGHALFSARRYDEALEYFQKTLVMNPNYLLGHLWIADVYDQKGMYEEAIDEINKAMPGGGNIRAISTLGYTYALAGRRDEARKVLDQLKEVSKQKYVPPIFFAIPHLALGEKDQAFEWLDKAFEERHSHLIHLKVHPVYDPLRSDPRFASLLRRVGFPS
jgi:tetratricopeptide (TPR) repeat protein